MSESVEPLVLIIFRYNYAQINKSGGITLEGCERVLSLAIKQYAEWSTRWHECKQNYSDPLRLQAAVSHFTALCSVDIVCKSSSFTNPLLLDASH